MTYLQQQYHSDPIQLLSEKLADQEDAYTVFGPIYSGMLFLTLISPNLLPTFLLKKGAWDQDLIDIQVLGSSFSGASHFSFAYAQQLSRVALSLGTGITDPSLSLTDYISNNIAQGAQIPLAPFILFNIFLFFFGVSVLMVGLRSNTDDPVLRNGSSGSRAHLVRLAQIRLTSISPIIYELICMTSNYTTRLKKSGCEDPEEILRDVSKEDEMRINVGVLDEPSLLGEDYGEAKHFGISTGPILGLEPLDDAIISKCTSGNNSFHQ